MSDLDSSVVNEIRSINDLGRNNNKNMGSKVMKSYFYSWGFVLWVFWTIIVGAIILWGAAHHFNTGKKPNTGHYERDKVDQTSYLGIFFVSAIIGFILTVITLWVYSLTQNKKGKKNSGY